MMWIGERLGWKGSGWDGERRYEMFLKAKSMILVRRRLDMR